MFVKHQYEQLGGKLDLASYGRQGIFLGTFFNLIGIIDADGWLIMSDRPLPRSNLADREHFLVHVPADTGQLFMSKPVLGRSSGKWAVQFTRRINTPGGGFGGAVVTSLNPEYFNQFYKSIDTGENGVVALIGTDGIVRARSNSGKSNIGQDLSGSRLFEALKNGDNGNYSATSSNDGIHRLYSFRKLPEYPLIVLVGISETTVLKDYAEHRNVLLGLGGFISLLIGAAAAALVRHMRLQQRVEQTLRHSEQEALSASRMKSEFLARMSHELRTPLNGILGFSEYLRDNEDLAEKRDCAATIYESGTHLLCLVNAILDLAKIEAGHMEVDRQPLELAPLVNSVVAIQRAFATQKDLYLNADFAPSAPQAILADQTKLVQILNNLVHNAIKFTDTGGVEVHVRSLPGEVLFVVSDTGPGIPTSVRHLVFDRFKQLDSFAKRSQGGTGLGLALAKELVELMGGRIWIESRNGGGSVFNFTIPHEKGAQ
jgi:signal transduction histidine kinase